MNESADVKVAFNDFILKAVGTGLEKYPIMTGQLAGDAIKLADAIHVGLAISVPDGLVAPLVGALLRGLREHGVEVRWTLTVLVLGAWLAAAAMAAQIGAQRADHGGHGAAESTALGPVTDAYAADRFRRRPDTRLPD